MRGSCARVAAAPFSASLRTRPKSAGSNPVTSGSITRSAGIAPTAFMLWFNDQLLPQANHELAALQSRQSRQKILPEMWADRTVRTVGGTSHFTAAPTAAPARIRVRLPTGHRDGGQRAALLSAGAPRH